MGDKGGRFDLKFRLEFVIPGSNSELRFLVGCFEVIEANLHTRAALILWRLALHGSAMLHGNLNLVPQVFGRCQGKSRQLL